MPDLVGSIRLNANICDVREREFDVVLRDAKGIARMSVTVIKADDREIRPNEEFTVLLCVEGAK